MMNSKNGTSFQSVIHGEEELDILIVFKTNTERSVNKKVLKLAGNIFEILLCTYVEKLSFLPANDTMEKATVYI